MSQFLNRNSGKNFILLQEVDIHSKQSYYINEKGTFATHLDYNSNFAINYAVKFVPIPVLSPMGQIKSGIMSFGKFVPDSSARYGFSGVFSWPIRLFNLRRCMLVNRYQVNNGKKFVLINIHLSAFDNGSLKKLEMQYLKSFLDTEFAEGNYIVMGGDWNQSPPGFPITQFGTNYKSDFFILNNIHENFMSHEWKWAFDSSIPTNRYLNEAYLPGKTFCCLIDFFLVSPNVEVINNKTINLNFINSDHNPISMKFKLKE